MLNRRTFTFAAAASISGVSGFSLLGTPNDNNPTDSVLLELINDSGKRVEIEASVGPVSGSHTTTRRSPLSDGERAHFHLDVDNGEEYHIRAFAEISLDGATFEIGGEKNPEITGGRFETVPVSHRTTLQGSDRIEIQLMSDDTLKISVS